MMTFLLGVVGDAGRHNVLRSAKDKPEAFAIAPLAGF